MNAGFTEIALVVDKSGSMGGIKQSTIDAVNKFLDEQQGVVGDASVTMTLFDTTVTCIAESVPIGDAKKLDGESYQPNGNTALLDAIGLTIDKMGVRFSIMSEDERPEHVVVVIMTDGEENASVKYDHAKVKEMIQHQTDAYNWKFIFLGAGIDADVIGSSLGIPMDFIRAYGADELGQADSYAAACDSVSSLRGGDDLSSVRND